MVQTRLQEKSRMAEERFQAIEQRIQTLDTTLQGLLTGFNAGIASLRQEIQEIRVAGQNSSRNQDRLQLWHLHQQGSVADFNSVFDSFSANLNVPEDYLVDAYVYGLKKEIADSVGLFHPRTIQEAKILARMQEIMIEMQTEKARKDLEYQSKTLFVKNKTQEAVEYEPEEQEPSISQETNDDNHEVSIIHDDDASSKPISDVPGSVSASLLFVVNSPVHELLQIERNSCASKKNMFEGLEWQDLKCTWLTKDEFEKSKRQLVATFPTFQLLCNFSLWQKNVDGLQLDGIFLHFQEYFEEFLGLQMLGQFIGLVLQGKGPISWLHWVISIHPVYMSINWAFHIKLSPTSILLPVWFRGELITMLYGRLCFLSKKRKGKGEVTI